jgi:hypothetical protein
VERERVALVLHEDARDPPERPAPRSDEPLRAAHERRHPRGLDPVVPDDGREAHSPDVRLDPGPRASRDDRHGHPARDLREEPPRGRPDGRPHRLREVRRERAVPVEDEGEAQDPGQNNLANLAADPRPAPGLLGAASSTYIEYACVGSERSERAGEGSGSARVSTPILARLF